MINQIIVWGSLLSLLGAAVGLFLTNTGLFGLVSTIVLNCIGIGGVVLIHNLIFFGTNAFISWFVIGAGAICVGLVFIRLSEEIENSTSFLYDIVANQFTGTAQSILRQSIFWTYLLSRVILNAITSILIVKTISIGNPQLDNFLTFLLVYSLDFIINAFGVTVSALVANILTGIRIIVFIGVPILSYFFLPEVSITSAGLDLVNVIKCLAPITFSFLGIESVFMQSQPDNTNLKNAVWIGGIFCTIIYILNDFIILNVCPNEPSPYVYLFKQVFFKGETMYVVLFTLVLIGSFLGKSQGIINVAKDGNDLIASALTNTPLGGQLSVLILSYVVSLIGVAIFQVTKIGLDVVANFFSFTMLLIYLAACISLIYVSNSKKKFGTYDIVITSSGILYVLLGCASILVPALSLNDQVTTNKKEITVKIKP